MARWDNTQEWKEYQLGLDYNSRINLYANTELNWNMYNGKQWVGVITNGLSKWTFNICKSAINYFIAFICSQKVKLQYSADNIPDDPQDENDAKIKEFTEKLSKMADMKWEKDKLDSKLRELMLDGATTGDFCAYVYWDKDKPTGQLEQGDFCTELVDGINVMFGNPNNRQVEAQPYILILRRSMVSELKKRARDNGVSEDLIKTITSDNDTQYQAGVNGKIELDNNGDSGKALSILKLWKKDQKVYWNESAKYCPIRKDVDLGISRYPIAWANWDIIKNSYHGMPAIEGIIDNQISINQLFAMVSYWMKMSAFGKVIYDETRLTNWSNQVGVAVKAQGEVTGIVQQLEAGNFNAAVLTIIDMAIKYTKDFIGANDSLLGQVNPEQASGTAIIATQKQASMPLGNIMANRDQFVEDLGLIWGEFFLKKYKNRKVSYKENEKVVTDQYSTEGMEDILLQCKVDVGPSSYWSEISGIQALDKLLEGGQITKLQYFERIAKMNIIPDVQGLIKDTQEEMQMVQQQQMMQQQQVQDQQQIQGEQQMQQEQMEMQQAEKAKAFVEQLPEEAQQIIASIGDEAYDFTIKLMQMQRDQQAKAITEMIGGE